MQNLYRSTNNYQFILIYLNGFLFAKIAASIIHHLAPKPTTNQTEHDIPTTLIYFHSIYEVDKY